MVQWMPMRASLTSTARSTPTLSPAQGTALSVTCSKMAIRAAADSGRLQVVPRVATVLVGLAINSPPAWVDPPGAQHWLVPRVHRRTRTRAPRGAGNRIARMVELRVRGTAPRPFTTSLTPRGTSLGLTGPQMPSSQGAPPGVVAPATTLFQQTGTWLG
jgi:hypothetical protein